MNEQADVEQTDEEFERRDALLGRIATFFFGMAVGIVLVAIVLAMTT